MPIQTHTAETAAQAKTLENRTFGLIFSGIFAVIAIISISKGNPIINWPAIASLITAVSALIVPVALTPFNFLFQKFGLLMHKITNPIFMGLVFFGTVLPTGIVMRLLRKDPMHRKFDAKTKSYWIVRETHPITKESFDDQF